MNSRITKDALLRQIDYNIFTWPNRSHLIVGTVGDKLTAVNDLKNEIILASTIEEAYSIFSERFIWDPAAKMPAEVIMQNEYNDILGEAYVNTYMPSFYNADISDEDHVINYFLNPRLRKPLNRLNPGDKTIITPIPTVQEDSDLEALLASRATELAAINKDIYLMWSGGVSSTLALYALSDAGIQFHIILDDNTADENPPMYEDILKGSIPGITGLIHQPKPLVFGEIVNNDHNLVITGGNGDEIFGVEVESSVITMDNRFKLVVGNIDQSVIDLSLPYLDQFLPAGYIDDMTVGEWQWAINLVWGYQFSSVKMKRMFGTTDIINFFDTEAFNGWSINNYKLLGDKALAKDLIYKYNNDSVYLTDKGKVDSYLNAAYLTGKNTQDDNITANTQNDKFYKKNINSYGNSLVLPLELTIESTVLIVDDMVDGDLLVAWNKFN